MIRIETTLAQLEERLRNLKDHPLLGACNF